jgi:hypothetical protein
MIVVGAERLERRLNPASGRLTTALIGPHPGHDAQPETNRPQLTAVESDGAADPIGVHFHQADQFQLFISGAGTVATHPVRAGSLHYADAYRPYGPITPSKAGLHFLTLRASSDFGAHFMPESRVFHSQHADKGRDRRPRSRNISVDLFGAVREAPTGLLCWTTAMSDGDDLWAAVAKVEPGSRTEPRVASGAGMFVAVLAGAAESAGHLFEPGTAAFLASGETLPEVRAGDALGAIVCLMQLPLAPGTSE